MDDDFGVESDLDNFYVSMLDKIIAEVEEHGIAVVAVNGKPVGLFKDRSRMEEGEAGPQEAEIIPFPKPDSDTKH